MQMTNEYMEIRLEDRMIRRLCTLRQYENGLFIEMAEKEFWK